MPRRRKYARSRAPARRRWKRRRVIVSRDPITQTTVAKLRYVTRGTLNPPAAGNAFHFFRANSVFDPDYSIGGHQPMGFDQYAALYNEYTVLGSRIKYTILPTGSPYQMSLALQHGSGTGTLLSVDTMAERKEVKSRLIAGVETSAQVLTMNYSAKHFEGVTNVKDDDDQSALTNTNPVNDPLFVCLLGPADGSADAPSANYMVELEYIVRFKNPLPLGPS